MEIIGVTDTAVDMLVGKRGDPKVTLVGLPGGNNFRCFNCKGRGHRASECPSLLNMNWERLKKRFFPQLNKGP